MPDHVSVQGNERVDQLANSAIIEERHAMDQADITSAIREAGQTKDLTNKFELVLSEMTELGVKLGVPKKSK